MNIETWNFKEYQKEKERYIQQVEKEKEERRKQREIEAKTDTYYVEWFANGKMYHRFLGSTESEEWTRKRIISGLKEAFGVEEKNIEISKQTKRVAP